MNPPVISLRVLAAYARDIGRGVARIDSHSMDMLGASNGDVVEIIGKKDGTDARCYQLLPSDEGQDITRIDPALRKMIGVTVDDTVTIRKIADSAVSVEKARSLEPEESEAPVAPQPESRETETVGSPAHETAATAPIPSAAAMF